jgi:iron complex outermembrane receptor protein
MRDTIRGFLFIWVAVLCGIFPDVVLAADESAEDDYFEMSLAELMDVDIYSASKYQQRASQAPSSVTVITQEEIRLYGYRNISDILRMVPGFYDTYDRNYSYIGVRGFGRPGDYNSRILLLIDGHRFNDNVGDCVLFGNELPLDIDLIDRVEIVRGPGSALYGSNALFAVVSIFTKNGGSYQGGEVSYRTGSGRHTQGRLTYGNRYDNGLDFLVSGTYGDWEGKRLYYEEFDDPSTQNGRVRNDDENLKNFFIEAGYADFTLRVASSQREKGVPTAAWGTVFGARGTRAWDDYTLIGLTWDHAIDETFSVLGRLSYHHYNYDGQYVYDDEGAYENHDYWKGRWMIGEVQLTKQFANGHKVVAGAETQYNIRQDQKNWDEDVYLNDRRHSKSWGVYIQDEFRVADNLILNVGLRRDVYDATGATLNPRAALIYNLSDKQTLKFLAGKAFRSPSGYELYYHDGEYTTKPNPELKPETIKTYEVVFENRFNNHWKATASGFYYQMDDLIDQVVDPDDDLMQYQNISQVTARGVELGLEGKWENGLRGRVGYSYVSTLDKSTRSSLANSPSHMVNFNLIYPLIEKRLFAGIDTKYSGKRKTLSGRHADDAIVTNLALTYVDAVKNLDVQVGVYNLFDVTYDHPGFIEHEQDTLEQDGRTWALKLTYRF